MKVFGPEGQRVQIMGASAMLSGRGWTSNSVTCRNSPRLLQYPDLPDKKGMDEWAAFLASASGYSI